MKKQKTIIMILALACGMTLMGCQNADGSQPNDSTEQEIDSVNKGYMVEENADGSQPNESTEQETVSVNKGYMVKAMLYQASEAYAFREEPMTGFDAQCYQDDTADATFNVTLGGQQYLLTYEESAVLPLSDISVHTYKYDYMAESQTETMRVLVDTQSGQMVKCVNVPLSADLDTEQDYVEFVKGMVPPTTNWEAYAYECTTHFYTEGENSFRSQVVDGFHTCSENETLGCYSLYYTKSVNGIQTAEHISAEIDGDSFSIEIIDWAKQDLYDEETGFISKEHSDQINALVNNNEEAVHTYLSSCVQSGYSATKITITGRQLFYKNGKMYMLVTTSVAVTDEQTPGDGVELQVKMICEVQ